MDAARLATLYGLRDSLAADVHRRWETFTPSLRQEVGTQERMIEIGFAAEVNLFQPLVEQRFTEEEYEALVSALEDVERRFPGAFHKMSEVGRRLIGMFEKIGEDQS